MTHHESTITRERLEELASSILSPTADPVLLERRQLAAELLRMSDEYGDCLQLLMDLSTSLIEVRNATKSTAGKALSKVLAFTKKHPIKQEMQLWPTPLPSPTPSKTSTCLPKKPKS